MAKNDVRVLRNGAFGDIGSRRFVVASGGTPPAINAGEPVAKALAGTQVTALATNKPVVATDFLAGIATSTSTETASTNGVVDVQPLVPGTVYLCAANVAATWNTQAKYDALVGSRVLFDLTAGVYTVLAADSATSGLVVEPLDITQFPGMVAFSLRQALSYTA